MRIKIPASPINPNGVEAERLIEQEQGGAHPRKAKRCGQHCHRHRRQTAHLGIDDDQHGRDHQRKTFTKATLAFRDSSMFPPISMRYPMGGREMKLLVSSTELKRF
ncbi:hypothetical protein GGE48_002611 [Rhizobium leguminosarum]|nr:hypothetical protein [Rhizobium leguminosarum]